MPKQKTHKGAAKRFKVTRDWQGGASPGDAQPHPDQEDHQAEAQPAQSRRGLARVRRHDQVDAASVGLSPSHITRSAAGGRTCPLEPRPPAQRSVSRGAGPTAPLVAAAGAETRFRDGTRQAWKQARPAPQEDPQSRQRLLGHQVARATAWPSRRWTRPSTTPIATAARRSASSAASGSCASTPPRASTASPTAA